MRELTKEEVLVVAGGRGLNVGDVGSGNALGNGNAVNAGGNTIDASNTASNNDVTVNVDTNNRAVDRLEQKLETYLDRAIGGIL